MGHRSFIKKIRWLASVFLLCLSVSGVYVVSPAHAEDSLVEGLSYTCKWKYEPLHVDSQGSCLSYKLTIFPLREGYSGTLEHWGEKFLSKPSWCSPEGLARRSRTTHVEIKKAPDGSKPVKARTCLNMFDDFAALTDVDLSGLDVTGITDMRKMFHGCKNLGSLNVEGWDTSSVTEMGRLFQGCENLKEIKGIESWNTSNVLNMRRVFEGCFSLTTLDLSGWSTSSDTDMLDMFGAVRKSRPPSASGSLSHLILGEKFRFRGCSGLYSLVSLVVSSDGERFHWIQVDLAKNGVAENPKGRAFHLVRELIEFHNGRQEGSGFEAYVCAGFGRTSSGQQDETSPALRSQRSNGHAPEFVGESSAEEPRAGESSVEEPRAGESSVEEPRAEGQCTGWYKHDNLVFYYCDGRRLTGWQELRGTIQNPSSLWKNWFYFDDAGVMLTGRRKLVGGYRNARGVQEQHWFALDEVTGAQIRYWQRVIGRDGETWYYHRPEDGSGLLGRHRVVGGFANARGIHELNWFYFDTTTGAEIRGWHKIIEGGIERWYYYRDGDGIMLKGQHRLKGGDDGGMNWFYFDEATGMELRSCWKDIPSQGKTCYYGSDGAMYKGWRKVGGRNCYFDRETGALV